MCLVVVPRGCINGFRRADRRGSLRSVLIFGVLCGSFALVFCACVHDFWRRLSRLVGLFVMVTAGACPASSLLCLGAVCLVLSCTTFNSHSALVIIFLRFVFGRFLIASSSSLCTASACCVGLKSGRMQCCGNRSYEPEVRYAPVSGM